MNTVIPRVETLYDPGKPNRKYPEDGDSYVHPFFVIIDGYSIAYNPYDENSPRLFNGFTSGQLVRNLIMEGICLAKPDQTLESLAFEINKKIGQTMNIEHRISLKNAGLLPGASVVLGKICKDHIGIIQAGDCYAIWQHKSSEIKITENRILEIDLQATNNFARLIKEHQGNKLKAWGEHHHFLAELRRKHANKEQHAIFNGQPGLKNCWQKITIPLEGLKSLILLTDGFIPSNWMKNEKKLAKEIVRLYRFGYFGEKGLSAILAWARIAEEKNAEYSHEEHAEATAMALTFE